MKAYRRFLTINDPRQLILADLPFQKGQQVEVVFLTNEEPDEVRLESLNNLFKTTQSLPQVQSLTDEEIAAEIELYRSGQ
jgi:hypothetical protein